MMPKNFNLSLLQQHLTAATGLTAAASLTNNNLGGIPNADSAHMWQAMQKAQTLTVRRTGQTETQVNQHRLINR